MRKDKDKNTSIDINPDKLRIWTVEQSYHQYTERLKDGRCVTRKVNHPIVTEYVDISTGEIVSVELVSMLGVNEINLKVMRLKQDLILSKLRPEVLSFANFLLKFRNKRRGISPDIETICEWYSTYSGMRKDNVKRYVSVLKEVGVLASDTLLMPVFQISGRNTKGSDHLSEDFRAEELMREIMRRKEWDKAL